MKPAPTQTVLPAPVRPLVGLILLAGSLGFTGVLAFLHTLIELFD